VRQGIRTGLYDVVGHIDMIKRVGDSLVKIVPKEVDKTLDLIKFTDMSIEVNSSGYRKKVAESYPGFDWIPQIKDKRIPVSVGSDAHAPDQVGLSFAQIYGQLKNAGIQEVVSYQKRRKHFQKI
jgi:histidinol-phosphatase (PHP family)